MLRISHIAMSVLCALSLPLVGCAAGPQSELLTGRPAPENKTIVLEGNDPFAEDIARRALRENGWEVVNTNLAANNLRQRIRNSSSDENSTTRVDGGVSSTARRVEERSTTTDVSVVSAVYYGEVRAFETSYCIGITGENAGRRPEYSPLILSIYQIDSGKLAFTASVSGCSGGLKKKMSNLLEGF